MTEEERQEYLKAYYDNEADANKQMSFANAFAAILMLVIWIFYLTGFFQVSSAMLPLINIVFPIGILTLGTPLLYVKFKKDFLRKPRYKNFVVFSFVLVILVLNLIIPKHTLLAWALCIIMTNHYYDPKLGRKTFIVVMVLLLLAMYGSMFVGEYDPNLIGNGVIIDGKITYVNGINERYNLLHQMLLEGENRYLKVFLYYYIPRAGILTLIFLVSNSLNIRTYKLLVSEIHVNSEQEKTRTELEVAKDIQLATLPKELLVSEDVEVQAELRAAKEVGGDFYDYSKLDDEHVSIVIADVSGKGVPAAMFMMKAITCFRNFVSKDRSPAETLRLVNKTIYKGNDNKMFITCFLAIINTKTGEMKFSNAGHNPPIVGQKKNYHFLKCNSGFILGCMEEAYVVDETYKLHNGDTITLYTDGITEAMNFKREQYSEERLLYLFNRKQYSCLVELHHELKEDVDRFVNGAPQSDDMTYLTLKYHGDKYVYKEKEMPAKKENIPEMLECLKEFAENQHFDSAFSNNLLVVGDELLSNIAKYGYKEEEGFFYLRLLYNLNQKQFVMTIVDAGIEFNPFEVDNKPLEGDISKREEGGLGILIVKKMMSEYAYDRVNGKNIIVLKKTF